MNDTRDTMIEFAEMIGEMVARAYLNLKNERAPDVTSARGSVSLGSLGGRDGAEYTFNGASAPN